jgi:hypothetical protein
LVLSYLLNHHFGTNVDSIFGASRCGRIVTDKAADAAGAAVLLLLMLMLFLLNQC